MMALVTTTFVSLVGFYIVKNAIDRDRQTGVGDILAATPLGKVSYLLGKLLSNFAVLASMVVVLALAAIAMQFLAAEDHSFHAWALLSPFLLLTLPAMALTAAMALMFETMPLLRGGFGNVFWFFAWSFGIALPGVTKTPQIDPFGFWIATQSIMAAARAGIPGYKNDFELTIVNTPVTVASGFHWNGLDWTATAVLLRLMWVAAAILLALCGVLFFDRFDPARSRGFLGAKSKRRESAGEEGAAEERARIVPRTAAPAHLAPLASQEREAGFIGLLAVELRLALKGYHWWWYAVAAGLLIAQLAAPLEVSRGPLLTAAWIWPVLIWSALGTREARFGTAQLIYSCPHILTRQLPAAWIATALVAALTGGGAAIRMGIAGQHGGLVAWSAGVMFIASLALALGVWSGTSKAFEGLYTTLWYVGPLNRVPGLDFTGNASRHLTLRYARIYFLISAILVAAAFFRRARQLGRN
jgi:hypothetical protein